jgi:hypothetical protein
MPVKLHIAAGLLLLLLSCTSCEKEDPTADCDTRYYLPADQLDWLPYYASQGDTLPNEYFLLESDTYYLAPQELIFVSENQDSQTWRLVYVVDKFNAQIYNGCPLYQEIRYAVYNSEIEMHLELGFVYRDTNYVSSSENTALYIPMLNLGACTTDSENWQGILGGTCYSTAFDVHNHARNRRVELLDAFETPSGNYEQVFKVRLDHAPDSARDYELYLAKGHGLVAYRNHGVLWSL